MSQIKPERVHGIVQNQDKARTTTVVMENKRKVVLDRDTSNSLLKRIDKDKARAERIKGG